MKPLLILLLMTATALAIEPPVVVEATHYAGNLAGKPMANTSPYDPTQYTCAYESIHQQPFKYPLGTILKVTYQDVSILVELTDRHGGKTGIDLSFMAFIALLGDEDWIDQGRLKGVVVEVLTK